jgi:5-methylcytosine-specific restriction protein A
MASAHILTSLSQRSILTILTVEVINTEGLANSVAVPEEISWSRLVLTMLSFFGGNPSGNVDKSKYEHLTMSIRQTVLERARRRCQQCSVKFSPSVHPGFEHINGSLKDNRPNNLRALCPECFKLVAKKENRKGMVGNIRYAFGRMIK